jgi:hypothetical protein
VSSGNTCAHGISLGVNCSACANEHMRIAVELNAERDDRPHCSDCLNESTELTHYEEHPTGTRSTPQGAPADLCDVCRELRETPLWFTRAEMRLACEDALPHLRHIPRLNLIQAMEMTARHLFVYGEEGRESLVWNIREQFKYLDKHGLTRWSMGGR